jgi:hypothetical protein
LTPEAIVDAGRLIGHTLETILSRPPRDQFVTMLAAKKLQTVLSFLQPGFEMEKYSYLFKDPSMTMYYRAHALPLPPHERVLAYLAAHKIHDEFGSITAPSTNCPAAWAAFTVVHWPMVLLHNITSILENCPLTHFLHSMVRVMEYVRITSDNHEHRLWINIGELVLVCVAVLINSPLCGLDDVSHWVDDAQLTELSFIVALGIPGIDDRIDWEAARRSYQDFYQDFSNDAKACLERILWVK